MQAVDKREIQSLWENIRNVPIFTPPVDFCESENELILFANMPGVPMDGVLKVVLPKTEVAKPRRIEVKSS